MLATHLIISKLIEPFKWRSPAHGDMLGQERGQALVRVFVSTAAALYLIYAHGFTNLVFKAPPWLGMATYAPLSMILFWRILRSNTSSALRRYFANFGDITVISYTMIACGETAMPLFLLYLWVTLGNGFRFGVNALLVSSALSLAGFGTVAILTEAWRNQPVLIISVMLALTMLPLHAAHRLMKRQEHGISTQNRKSLLIASFKWLSPTGGNILGRERGQALLRVFVSTIVTLYLYLAHTHDPLDLTQTVPPWLVVAGYALFSIVLFWRILRAKISPALRRYIANLADVAAISYAMIAPGEAGMPLFLLYLWITIGNGFRYGNLALLVSALLCLIGFSFVVPLTEAWRNHPAFTTSVAMTLILLPGYAAHLIHQLNKALAKVEEASAAKSEFLARMSHELRTPLNGILGAAELLETGRRLVPDERSLLQVIRESVDVSLRQINNVLDFSKIEAAKLVLERSDFDLHEVINTVAHMTRPLAAQKGLRFLVRIAPETPHRLVGDPHHLRAILLNLLSNAVKFTERGQVCLEIDGRVAAHQAIIRFEVRDTGIGIAPEALTRIFESFTQEDNSTTRSYGGTGLGTTIAKQLAELMGGHIGVESVKHKGSVFWCEIPFDQKLQKGTHQETLPGMRVLLVSADVHITEHYTHLTETFEAQSVIVGSGDEALEALARAVRLGNPVHAVLIDATLALQDDGGHRYKEICDKTGSINVPVILVSDIAPPVEQLREWGYSAVLARATEPRLLFATLHAVPRNTTEAAQRVVSVPPWIWNRRPAVRQRLLVADDNRTNLMIVRRMLEGAGYDVYTAESGDAALEYLCTGGYRLAILDMHMPGLDGINLLRRYRLMRPRARLPIIMLTANASLEAQQVSAEAGADAYLTKPVSAGELLGEVERLIKDTQVEALPLRAPEIARTENVVQGDDQNVLDISVLAELDRLYHNPQELALLITEYEREGRKLLEKIAHACTARNHSAFCDRVHALKSNAANVGAMRLMQACRQAEAGGIVEFMSRRPQLLGAMEEAFAESLAALRRLLRVTPHDTGRPKGPKRS